MIDVIGMYALLASTFSFNKVLLATFTPIFLAGLTQLGGSLELIPYSLYHDSWTVLRNKKLLIKLIISALCITYFAALLRFHALCTLESFRVCFFSSFDPFITALLAFFIKGQRLAWYQLLGMSVATLGTIPLLASQGFGGEIGIFSFPVIAAISTIVVNRFGWVLLSDSIQQRKIAPVQATAFMLFLGGSLLFITALATGTPALQVSETISWSKIGMLIYVTIVSNIICSTLATALLKKYSITFISLAEFLTPLFVALYGWFFLHEQITYHFFISVFFVACGLFLFSAAWRQKPH